MRLALAVAALCAWFVPDGQGTPMPPKLAGEKYSRSSSTQPISGVALVSWVTKAGQPKELDLAVIWRGRPGWFMAVEPFRESAGGTSTSFQQTITRGEVILSFQYMFPTRQLVIQDGAPIDLKDSNVVMVDYVDEPKKTAVVSMVTIPGTFTASGGVVEPLGKSNEIYAFLQCGAKMPQAKSQLVIDALCRDLQAANARKD